MNLTSQEIADTLNCPNPIIEPEKIWTEISTDSRTINAGSVFLALVGENFDGHDFLKQVLKAGAKALVVHKEVDPQLLETHPNTQIFQVKDTQEALTNLAYLQSQKLKDCIKVALTGTTGKTTTKYFAHQILGQDYPHFFSPKSFNNHIGVPLSLLAVQPEHKLALLEVGMNRPGEIKKLSEIISPDVSLVTMVGRGHLELVGSVRQVLEEKMSIYQQGQVHIINQDSPAILKYYEKNVAPSFSGVTLGFSQVNQDADVYMKIVEQDFASLSIEGHILGTHGEVKVPVSGSHNLTNILAAVCIASHSNLDADKIWKNLASLKTFWGRSEILESQDKVKFYFDAYNANPESMNAFLDQVAQLKEPPMIILGEMLELGTETSSLHYDLGVKAAKTPHKKLWFVGPSSEAFKKGYETVKTAKNITISDTYKEDIALEYKSMLQGGDWIALKGSRGMHLETFLSQFSMI